MEREIKALTSEIESLKKRLKDHDDRYECQSPWTKLGEPCVDCYIDQQCLQDAERALYELTHPPSPEPEPDPDADADEGVDLTDSP